MDAARITNAYAGYHRVISWERHLRVVDELASWSPEELLELHEGLVHHVAAGTWVSTAIGLLNQNLPEDPKALATLIEEIAAGGEIHTAELGIPDIPEIPPDRIGLPVGLIWSLPSPADVPRTGRAYAAASRKVASYFNHTNYLPNGEGLILRAAPWAYHRITGRRMAGFDADTSEEALSAGAHEPDFYSIRSTIARDVDRVELTFLSYAVPTAEAARADWSNDSVLASLLRSLRARRVGEPLLEFVRGRAQFVPGVGVADGQLISSGAQRAVAKSNSLYSDLRAMLLGDTRKTGQEPLADDQFWNLISLLGGRVTTESSGALIAALAKRPVKEIKAFHESLVRKLFSLDRRGLLSLPSESGAPPMSDDVFLHFRCAIVAAGADVMKRVLDAGQPIVEDEWRPEAAEDLLFVASAAYGRRTDRAFEVETSVSFETGSNPEGWDVSALGSGAPAYVVRGTLAGEERIQFWRTSSAAEAVRRHGAANPGSVVDPDFDVLPHPNVLDRNNRVVPIGIVYFARPVE